MLLMREPKRWYTHFFSFWNTLEVMCICSFIISFVTRIYIWGNPSRFEIEKRMTLYEYPYMLEDYIVAARTEQASTSIFLIISWLKVFKYFTLNQRLNLLAVTISEVCFF